MFNGVPQTFILSVLGLFIFGILSVFSTGTVGQSTPEGMFLQFGGFGLCAYMVFQNYRAQKNSIAEFAIQRKELLEVIRIQQAKVDEKDLKLEKRDEKLEKLHNETINVIRKCTKV